jgi:DNA-binding HxlR family transcriptional regulator
MLKITPTPTHDCKKAIMSIHDAMYVLGGKWKIRIIAGLLYGPKRYSDLLRDVCGISGKVLSRELKEMEMNRLVKRSVRNDKPITVIYELTDYGDSTKEIIGVLADWGERHREIILQKPLEISYDEVPIVH